MMSTGCITTHILKAILIFFLFNNHFSVSKHHDIAILKLETPVKFTYFIQPICLPDKENSESARPVNLTVTGWGRTDYFDKQKELAPSHIKLKVILPFVDSFECSKVFIPQRLRISPSQICAGGARGKDSVSKYSRMLKLYLVLYSFSAPVTRDLL